MLERARPLCLLLKKLRKNDLFIYREKYIFKNVLKNVRIMKKYDKSLKFKENQHLNWEKYRRIIYF